MSKEGNSRRDAEIAALHAVVVCLGMDSPRLGFPYEGPWWVFTSHAVNGEVVFTYKRTDGASPGGGWVEIPQQRIAAFLHRALVDGGEELRAGAAP